MTKVVLSISYRELVLNLEDAVPIINALATAERFKTQYVPSTDTTSSRTDFHIWSDASSDDSISIRVLSDHAYRAAKLRGDPNT
jgi:hypothetical protein